MAMQIQSLSLDVPAPCLNSCSFCVAHMHGEQYVNQMDHNKPFYDLYLEDYIRRLQFARDNGCNTIMLTGNGEPLLNRSYLQTFSIINKYALKSPFSWIEIQTSGTKLDQNYLRFLRNTVWINLISLSLSDIFDSHNNAYINQTMKGFEVHIPTVCDDIKKYDFSLRLSLNMTDAYNDKKPEEILAKAKRLHADQITFRKLYSSGKDTPQDKWIEEHSCRPEVLEAIGLYIRTYGRKLRKLEFGQTVYSIEGMSVVIDDDCMSTAIKEDNSVKYLILRPDCKLYSLWNDSGSLIF